MVQNGFAGKILRINLKDGSKVEEKLSTSIARSFLGANGYSTKILWDELNPGIDALGEENKLILSTGVLTGTICPGTDSWVGCFKSPLTGCWAEARCGGGFGPELKRAGYDIIIIEGCSDREVYLYITNDKVEIKDAKHLWGKTIPQTEKLIKRECDNKSKIISIGPAGENLVLFSSIMSEGRAAARCGSGAVMGSKKLKAIAVRGTGSVCVKHPEEFIALVNQIEKEQGKSVICGNKPGAFGAGTSSWLPSYGQKGVTLTKNGVSNCWENMGDYLYNKMKNYVVHEGACEGCTMACVKYCRVKDGKWKTPVTDGPEYETAACFGHYIMNNEIEPIIHCNHLCDVYGLDTISCGSVIAFLMECFEKGWLTEKETDGINLQWGNMDAVVSLIKKITNREGFGDRVADGAFKLAQSLGKDAEKIVMHVKGLDIPAHDPRGIYAGKSWLIQYATSNRGACHIHPQEPSLLIGKYEKFGFVESDWPGIDDPTNLIGKANIVKWVQDYGDVQESMGTCKFHSFSVPCFTPERYAKLVSLATGYEIDSKELLSIGERIFNLQRCFNIREGIRRTDDVLPSRLFKRPEFGPFSDKQETETSLEDFNAAMDEYYEYRGWDKKTGIPHRTKLQALALSEEAEELYQLLRQEDEN